MLERAGLTVEAAAAVVRTTRIVGDTLAAKLDMSHILDLVEAAEGGDVAAVAELLQAGLSVNAQVTGRFYFTCVTGVQKCMQKHKY